MRGSLVRFQPEIPAVQEYNEDMKDDECRVCAIIRGEKYDGRYVFCPDCRDNDALRNEFEFYYVQWKLMRSAKVFLVLFPVLIVLGAWVKMMNPWMVIVNLVIFIWNLRLYDEMGRRFGYLNVKERLFVMKLTGRGTGG